MRSLMSEFKQFLLRGNVVDLAVGIVIGVAFAAVVQGMVRDLLTPLIAAIFHQPDFGGLTFKFNKSVFRYGDFFNLVIAFITIALAVFFFVVKPINTLVALSRHGRTLDPTTRKCPECLSEIPLKARRCMFCTVVVATSEPANQGDGVPRRTT